MKIFPSPLLVRSLWTRAARVTNESAWKLLCLVATWDFGKKISSPLLICDRVNPCMLRPRQDSHLGIMDRRSKLKMKLVQAENKNLFQWRWWTSGGCSCGGSWGPWLPFRSQKRDTSRVEKLTFKILWWTVVERHFSYSHSSVTWSTQSTNGNLESVCQRQVKQFGFHLEYI